ncbi:MAG TPA: ATP-dependent DNA ligase, partial [Micromonosporaceae bacterium]|nr:ATP-dependent DNA ligase [Micromonosporaceae bacterium]
MGEVAEYQVGGHTVRVSNPDRVYFPKRGFTKRDVVEYYIAVEEGILRALRDRPTTLERWPSGVFEGAKLATRQDSRGDAFYQKRVPKNAPPWVPTARIAFPSGRTADEICPTELAVIAWAANLGTIT